MAKTRQELSSRMVLALIFTVPLFFGGLTLWLWLVPLRPIFEPSTGTAQLLAVFAALVTLIPTLLLPMGLAMNGDPARDEPPRFALDHCLSLLWDILWHTAIIAAVPNVLGAVGLGIIAILS